MTDKQAKRLAFTLTAISKIIAGIYVMHKIDEISEVMMHPVRSYRKWRNKQAKEIKL